MATERWVTKKDQNKAIKYVSEKKISKLNENEYQYLHKNKKISLINVEKKNVLVLRW